MAFACGMIAHHQSVIAMAQVMLEHGDDPQMHALADQADYQLAGREHQLKLNRAARAKPARSRFQFERIFLELPVAGTLILG